MVCLNNLLCGNEWRGRGMTFCRFYSNVLDFTRELDRFMRLLWMVRISAWNYFSPLFTDDMAFLKQLGQ